MPHICGHYQGAAGHNTYLGSGAMAAAGPPGPAVLATRSSWTQALAGLWAGIPCGRPGSMAPEPQSPAVRGYWGWASRLGPRSLPKCGHTAPPAGASGNLPRSPCSSCWPATVGALGLWVPGDRRRSVDCSWREHLPGASDSVPASPGPPLDRNRW